MNQQSVDKIVLQLLQTTVLSQGTVSIQNLTGHFSQLPTDIRKKFNSTKAEVKKFLLAYPEIFVVNDETVSLLQKKDLLNLVDTSVQCEIPAVDNDANDSNDDEETEKRQTLNDCKGKIIRLFDVYGFIEFSSPNISISIYFDVVCFEDRRHENLSKLKVGDEVNFCAKQSVGHKAPYRATKVWRNGYSASLQGSERCYSSNTSLASQDSYQSEILNGAGKVMKITTDYGFIKPTGKEQGNVFFFRTKVQLPNVEEVENLVDIFKKGDFLYFSAIQSRKKNADAPWEAVKVSRTPLENAWNGLSKHCSKNEIIRTGSTSSTDCSYHSLGLDIDCKNDENHIYNQVGNIYQLASNEPLIHFGNNETAAVQPNAIYKNNKLIEEYEWEIDDGTKVQFNAEYDNAIWKAVLVWIGDKPQLSNKKSRKKKNTQIKESTISDLCEISLYDDQSDDGIWHTSSPHIDTGTWDEENNENWPALEPPVSTKSRSAEKMKLPKSENNPVFRGEKINISSDYEEKHNEANTSSYSTALSGDCQEVVNISNSKKNRKKKSICDADTSNYVTAVSKDCQQSKSNSSSYDRLQKYKMNNGWEEDSFNTENEKWPSLNELPASISKSSFYRSKDMHSGYINKNKCIIQEQMPNKSNYSEFVDHNNDIQENYYSDECDAQEIVADITYDKGLGIINPRSFEKVNNPVTESYDKFPDVTGTVINIHKYFAYIKADELDQILPFHWEQAFCDGCLVSKYYTDLSKAFIELDHINFTYCSMKDENGKEWKHILQVWKGKKPLQTTVDCIEQISSENQSSQQKENNVLLDMSDKGTSCNETAVGDILKERQSDINSPVITLINTESKNIEDSGVCMEELETNEYEDINKTTNGFPNCNSSPTLNMLALCQKEKEIEDEMKNSNLSTVSSSASISQLRATDKPSQIENNTKCAPTNSFLNHILGLTNSSKPESLNAKESLSHTISGGSQVSVKSQETQTEVITCDQGTQTFITGTVLSIEVFPQ